MSEILTKSRARNIFYGGSLFFVVVFVAMTIHSHRYVVNVSTAGMPLTPEVILGKHVWERHSCINCHTLHGEGAYFAPELGNVMTRWGVQDDPQAAYEVLDGWMAAQPSGIEGRRQMPLSRSPPRRCAPCPNSCAGPIRPTPKAGRPRTRARRKT
jgi:nitric oxide reductase subunit C